MVYKRSKRSKRSKKSKRSKRILYKTGGLDDIIKNCNIIIVGAALNIESSYPYEEYILANKKNLSNKDILEWNQKKDIDIIEFKRLLKLNGIPKITIQCIDPIYPFDNKIEKEDIFYYSQEVNFNNERDINKFIINKKDTHNIIYNFNYGIRLKSNIGDLKQYHFDNLITNITLLNADVNKPHPLEMPTEMNLNNNTEVVAFMVNKCFNNKIYILNNRKDKNKNCYTYIFNILKNVTSYLPDISLKMGLISYYGSFININTDDYSFYDEDVFKSSLEYLLKDKYFRKELEKKIDENKNDEDLQYKVSTLDNAKERHLIGLSDVDAYLNKYLNEGTIKTWTRIVDINIRRMLDQIFYNYNFNDAKYYAETRGG